MEVAKQVINSSSSKDKKHVSFAVKLEKNEIEIIDKIELKKGNVITMRDGKGNIKSVIEMDKKIVPISSKIVSLMKSRM